MPAQIEAETKDNDKLLSEAKARFKLAEDAERDNRALALDDLEFRAGKQWPDGIRADREADGRPCLIINKIPQFLQQITNDQRQNRPSIKVHPVDDGADKETAKVIQGLIRHIEYNSNADSAYDTAFDSAVTGGFGYWRITTDYVSPLSFEQEILIKRIRNPFSVFFDPHSQEPDGSDAEFAFVVEDMSKDEFETQFPNAKASLPGGWESLGNSEPEWAGSETVRIAEYFYKVNELKDIVLLSNNETTLAEQLPEVLPEGITVEKRRKTQVPVIKWCKFNGEEILEQTDWLGIYIPIVPVYGTELDIDGKRVLEGVIRNAKDPARMYNYWASAETEAIALAPRAPFIGYEGQFEGFEGEWATANRRNHAFLQVKPLTIGGQAAPLPQRNAFEPAVQAITQARMLAADDVKATTGIYDAALGARSNETSGIAIQRRNTQAQTSNFHFVDNLTRSLKHTGRILVDLLPKIYDTGRASRIIGEDGEQRIIKVNEPFVENGKTVLYSLDAGKYDITVDVGPSFASKRQEAVASMLDVVKAYPQLAQFAGDLLVKNMDWPGAQEFADRIKKTLPPGMVEDPKQAQSLPPQAKAQLEQQGVLIEQLTAKLNEAQDIQDNKLLELESKERIEFKKLEVQLEIERAKLDQKDALALLTAEIDQINQRMALLNTNQPIENESEESAPDEAGAMGAEPMGAQDPIGGESPSQPEGNVNDDPSNLY